MKTPSDDYLRRTRFPVEFKAVGHQVVWESCGEQAGLLGLHDAIEIGFRLQGAILEAYENGETVAAVPGPLPVSASAPNEDHP